MSTDTQNRIENIIRGAMLPVAFGGPAEIETHAPQAAAAIVRAINEGDE